MEPAGNSHGLSKTAAGMNESRARETEEHPGMVHGGQNQEGMFLFFVFFSPLSPALRGSKFLGMPLLCLGSG